MSVFDIIVRYREAFAEGLAITLKLAAITWISGLLVGGLLGPLAHRNPRFIGLPLRIVSFILSGVPFLVLLYWAHFPLQTMLHIVVHPFITAAVLLSALNAIIVAEVWRSALSTFHHEYILAAKTCGMTARQTFFRIQFPLVVRQAFPMLLAVQVAMLQMTLFASLISVDELFRVAQRIDATIHKPIEIYTALALFFMAICTPVYGMAFWLRRRFTRDISDR